MAILDLNLFDNSINNILYDSVIHTEVFLNKYDSSSNNIYDVSIATSVTITKFTNNSTVFYNPSIKNKIILSLYQSTSNTIRPLFIETETIDVSVELFDNALNNIFYNPSNVSFNFLKTLTTFNNKSLFYPVNIGSNRIISLVGLAENISYIFSPSVNVENIAYKGVLKKRPTIVRPKKFKFKFSDISFDMFPHPLTGDVPVIYDVDAINQSLNNILKTRTFERPFSSYNISSKIHELLFELSGATLEAELKNVIFNAIVNSEPRILLYEINVKNKPETNSVSIQIYYQIRTIDTIEKFETVLTRT